MVAYCSTQATSLGLSKSTKQVFVHFIAALPLAALSVPALAQAITGSSGYFAPSSALNSNTAVPLQTNAATVSGGVGEGYVGINKAGALGLLLGYKNDSTTGDPQGGAYIRQIQTEPLHIQVNNNVDAEVISATGATTFPVSVATPSLTASTLYTPNLLNDAAGAFTTQGSNLCQAPETGQLTSPAGVCMQYTPSVSFVGGAAAIFGLKGATTDYTSPALAVSAAASSGATSIQVTYNAAISNAIQTPSGGPASTITSSVSGAMPSGETIAHVYQGSPTTLTLTSPMTAALPAGATVTFTTPTGSQQLTALAGSVDLTAHQSSGGQAWAGNFIAQAEAGSDGAINGIEIDVANLSSSVGGYGVWLGNNGTQNMNSGFLVGAGTQGKGWQYGLNSQSSTNADVLSTSKATGFLQDNGAHTNGLVLQGTYSGYAQQLLNTTGQTASQQYLYEVTPQGGVVDGSPTPIGVASGFSQAATTGTTGMILVCSGTLATGTIAMPTTPLPKQVYRIASECTVSTLSFTVPSGTSVVGAAAGVSPTAPEAFVYDNDRSIWLRWQ